MIDLKGHRIAIAKAIGTYRSSLADRKEQKEFEEGFDGGKSVREAKARRRESWSARAPWVGVGVTIIGVIVAVAAWLAPWPELVP